MSCVGAAVDRAHALRRRSDPAGVGRATLYRHPDVGAEFERRLAERETDSDVPATLRDQVRSLKAELADVRSRHQEEMTRLRRLTERYANHIQALSLENESLRTGQLLPLSAVKTSPARRR